MGHDEHFGLKGSSCWWISFDCVALFPVIVYRNFLFIIVQHSVTCSVINFLTMIFIKYVFSFLCVAFVYFFLSKGNSCAFTNYLKCSSQKDSEKTRNQSVFDIFKPNAFGKFQFHGFSNGTLDFFNFGYFCNRLYLPLFPFWPLQTLPYPSLCMPLDIYKNQTKRIPILRLACIVVTNLNSFFSNFLGKIAKLWVLSCETWWLSDTTTINLHV